MRQDSTLQLVAGHIKDNAAASVDALIVAMKNARIGMTKAFESEDHAQEGLDIGLSLVKTSHCMTVKFA
ncbi:MAG: hypothetical protein ACAH08_07585 [Methylophilus sp.]